jgi:hypothetical protein
MFDQTNEDALPDGLAVHEAVREAALDQLAAATEFLLVTVTDGGEFSSLVSIGDGQETMWICTLLGAVRGIAEHNPQAYLEALMAIGEPEPQQPGEPLTYKIEI